MERDIRPIRIALAGTVGAIGSLLNFGPDQWVRPVSADTPTPVSTPATPARTPTPTGIPTPDVFATQIAEARATVTALAGQLQKERELGNIRVTATALSEQIDAARGTPTKTPTPTATPRPADATATAEATTRAAVSQELAGIQATATAQAERARVVPTAAPAPTVEQQTKKEQGGSPIGPIGLAITLLGGLAGVALLGRQGLRRLRRRMGTDGEEERR